MTTTTEVKNECKEVYVTLDGLIEDGISIKGYINDFRWNGWLAPFFDYEEMILLTNVLNELFTIYMADYSTSKIYYDKKKDAVVYENSDGCDEDLEQSVFKPSIIYVDNKPRKVYSLGDGWTFYQIEEPVDIMASSLILFKQSLSAYMLECNISSLQGATLNKLDNWGKMFIQSSEYKYSTEQTNILLCAYKGESLKKLNTYFATRLHEQWDSDYGKVEEIDDGLCESFPFDEGFEAILYGLDEILKYHNI